MDSITTVVTIDFLLSIALIAWVFSRLHGEIARQAKKTRNLMREITAEKNSDGEKMFFIEN